jgi:anti-sigma B factor antagonist
MAELNIRERQAGDITVLDMDGRITIVRQRGLAQRCASFVRRGKEKNSAEPGGRRLHRFERHRELVSSYTAINKEGGQLKLLSLTQKLRDLLTITKLLTVFDSYDDEAEALSNFK